ncbi:DUF2330 domain-containing protein [Chondromyces apiculatus]|nr:DUF2330 domain-containing protein [Chondromyces apiculatus]
MALANQGNVLRRRLALLALSSLPFVALPGAARAGGALLPSDDQTPVEQRVAVAMGPERTTVWTSLRFDGSAGSVGVVVPVPPLAALDLTSDAWLEALEMATAPRIFPPFGASATCPGEGDDPDAVHVAGDLNHQQTLPPAELLVLESAGDVALWAVQAGLDLSPAMASKLGAMQGKRFLVARFFSPGGPALTRTLRVVLPGVEPVLPLSLTQASGDDVRVTAWFIGAGRAELGSSTPVTVEEEALIWNADTGDSNYEDERMAALVAAGASGAVLECSSHEVIRKDVSLGGSVSIGGVTSTYFSRAVAYGDGEGQASTCAAFAASALSSNGTVSASCPRADQGVVDGTDACVENPAVGEVNPGVLRCGEGADDLAIALSGLPVQDAWLTRYTLRVPSTLMGTDRAVSFSDGSELSPELVAENVSLEGCEEGTGGGGPGTGGNGGNGGGGLGPGTGVGAGPSSGPGSPSGGSSGTTGGITYYDEGYISPGGCGCVGTADTADSSYGSGCSGDTSDSYDDGSGDDGCSGDTSDSYDDGSSDACSGDTSDSYYDDSSDSCSSDSSSSSDSCSGDSGGSEVDCDSGPSEETGEAEASMTKQKKRKGPRLSPMGLGMMAVVAPMRRLLRPRRRKGADADERSARPGRFW